MGSWREVPPGLAPKSSLNAKSGYTRALAISLPASVGNDWNRRRGSLDCDGGRLNRGDSCRRIGRRLRAHRGRTEGDRRLPNPDTAVTAPSSRPVPCAGVRLAIAQGAFLLQASLAKSERASSATTKAIRIKREPSIQC